MGAGCIVHCNKVSKPVKDKHLLLCINSIMYFLLTSDTLITFLKVLSHFILKVKNFMKYFKERVLKCFKIFLKFLNISSWNISSCIPTYVIADWYFTTNITCKEDAPASRWTKTTKNILAGEYVPTRSTTKELTGFELIYGILRSFPGQFYKNTTL